MGMSIAILVVIFFMAMVGKGKGIVNYKFTIEKIILTFLFLPLLANFAKGHLIGFVPEMAASIVSVVLSLVIVFLIIGFVLGKLAKIPEYEATGGDKFMGFVAGIIKGYTLIALLIMLYGISFADIKAPGMVTQLMKSNFINSKIENAIEYYRTSVYSAYSAAKSTDVAELSASSDVYSDVTVVAYIPWAGNPTTFPSESEPQLAPEPKKEKEKATKE